jgi:archaellin
MLFAVLFSGTDKTPRDDAASRADSERATREIIYAGSAHTSGRLELVGMMVFGVANGERVDAITIDLVATADSPPANFVHGASDGTVIAYIDATTAVPDVYYEVQAIVGDDDGVLEQGETLRITIPLLPARIDLLPSSTFTIEVKPATGSFLVLERTLPATLRAVNELN